MLIFFLIIPSVSAAVIQFPDQELASEYVFPIFKDPQASLNRNVTLAKRFEWRISGALRTDEPFFNPFSALSSLSFYWNESHGISISGLYFFPGLSNTGVELKNRGVKKQGTGAVDAFFDVGLAPAPLLAFFLNYQFSPLYGKISLTKTVTFNFALYSFLGAGVLGFKHHNDPIVMVPSLHLGVGQRFYINRYLAFDGGIDFLLYRGPNPILEALKYGPASIKPSAPAYEAFKTNNFFRFLARVGVAILL